MATVPNPILQQYAKLTEFLGLVMGPDYEVTLHDLTDKNRSIIAIANNHVSGRDVGAPLTNMALSVLRNKSYETSDYRLHYYGVSANGKELRTSALFIKEDGRLIGMLCINFDSSRYRAVSNQILALCRPELFASNFLSSQETWENPTINFPTPEKYRSTTDAAARDAVHRELERLGISADRLTAEERMHVIAALDADGIFLLKGAVKDTAAELRCSQASVYRYLSRIKSEHADSNDMASLP